MMNLPANSQRWVLAGLLASSWFLLGCATPRPEAFSLEGKTADPFTTAETATVLVFVSNDCPISNRYVPEIHRLHDRFAPRGVSFWLVHADADETADSIRRHAREYHITENILRDPNHALVHLSRVNITPSAAIFKPDRRLVYHGRIDDRFVALGQDRRDASQHDLADALEAVLAHRPVPISETKAVGCYISGLR